MRRVATLALLVLIFLWIGFSTGQLKLNFSQVGKYLPQKEQQIIPEKTKIVSEESVVIDAVDKVSPSVVTISIVRSRSSGGNVFGNPFDPFNFFENPQPRRSQQNLQQDIGSGFIVSGDGLIVTNKHVVSDSNAKYKVITKEDKTFEVDKIYRDPANDLAIIKIKSKDLKPVNLGDSSKIKVGQMAIAIGTALGEFRNTVTVGVVSGVGRGITAGSPFEGDAERLDNVIQTDAAINPGNSGGPLLNSSGEAIGINTAVSSEGQNIGFAIPINVVKDSLEQFNKTGQFQRPFLGVRYKMITKDLAIMNDIPEGAYVQEVVENSPAEKAGIKSQDIITKIDDKKVTDKDGGLSKMISGYKVGNKISIEVWRDGETKKVTVTVGENQG